MVLTSTHNLCFEQKYEKYRGFHLIFFFFFFFFFFEFLKVKSSIYLNRCVFVMIMTVIYASGETDACLLLPTEILIAVDFLRIYKQ